jgi:alkylation response protein AidB-like acyl-CoA dehydrogenase
VLLVTDREARIEIDGGRVRAEAAWLPAARADAVVALAGSRVALVTSGIELEPLRGAGLRAAGAGALRIRDARAELCLEDASGAARARARARLYVASLLLGAMRASAEFSRAYAQEREAFGRPIAHHQALAFLLTDMRMAVDGARLLVHEAAWRVDRGLPAEAAAASAFAECIDVARRVGPDGVQILGGHGFMADYPVEKHMRELRILGLLLGGFDAAVEEAGRIVCARDAPLALAAGPGL